MSIVHEIIISAVGVAIYFASIVTFISVMVGAGRRD